MMPQLPAVPVVDPNAPKAPAGAPMPAATTCRSAPFPSPFAALAPMRGTFAVLTAVRWTADGALVLF
jgi:hypothetical protein